MHSLALAVSHIENFIVASQVGHHLPLGHNHETPAEKLQWLQACAIVIWAQANRAE